MVLARSIGSGGSSPWSHNLIAAFSGQPFNQGHRIKSAKGVHALDERHFGCPHTPEVKLCFSHGARSLQDTRIRCASRNFLREIIHGFRVRSNRADGERQTVTVALPLTRFLPPIDRGPVLRRALARLAATCRSVTILRALPTFRWTHPRAAGPSRPQGSDLQPPAIGARDSRDIRL
jgi:hypothetical protein